MSVAQIMEELPRLSLAELRALERRAAELAAKKTSSCSPGDIKGWLARREARARGAVTGKQGSSIEEIINDIRDGR